MATIVLMGDIVGSRKLDREQRYHLQEQLNEALRMLSAKYHGHLGTPMGILAGDAYRVVVDDPQVLPDLILGVAAACRPYKVKQAVGVGGTYTADVHDPHLLDGPAFHNARDALDASEDIAFVGLGPRQDRVLTGLMSLLLHHQSGLKPQQWPVYELLIEGRSSKQIEAALGKSKQSVSQYKDRMGWSAFSRAREAMSEAIELFFSGTMVDDAH